MTEYDAQSGMYTTTMTHVHRWTYANYLQWVMYERMFFDTCERDTELERAVNNAEDTPPNAARRTVVFTLKRVTTGYAGFPHTYTQHMFLNDPDGDVPAP